MILEYFRTKHPKLIIVSHERSGTHFLINSLEEAFGYPAKRRIDLDYQGVRANFFCSKSILSLLNHFKGKWLKNIMKSHHPVEFFKDILPEVTREYTIIHIHRNPLRVMASFHKMLQEIEWNEGPKDLNLKNFCLAQPCGQLMRYQMKQEESMIARWKNHVDGWLAVDNVIHVTYEDLDSDYEETIRQLGQKLGLEVKSFTKPLRNQNVVHPSVVGLKPLEELYSQEDIRQILGNIEQDYER